MGTNYYWHKPDSTCKHCGHSDDDELHIGKSSLGWCFSLRIHPAEGIRDLNDWRERWAIPGSRIVDEYGREVTEERMLEVIVDRKHHGHHIADSEWLAQNHAAPGPNGLARHTYGNAVAGNGTYDLVDYEFS